MFASSTYAPGNNFTHTRSWHLTSWALNWQRQSLVKIKMLKYPQPLQKRLAQTPFLHYSWIRKNKAMHHGSPRTWLPTHLPPQPAHRNISHPVDTSPSAAACPNDPFFRTTSNVQEVSSVSRILRDSVQSFSFQVGPFILKPESL